MDEKAPKKYRAKMREVIVEKYTEDLPGLDEDVLSSSVIPAAQNRIRGDIFELWLQKHNLLDKPSPIFISKTLYKKRIADGIRGNSLIDAKVRRPNTSPSTSDLEQMEDYDTIITKGIKSRAVKGQERKGPFVKVIYIFNDESLVPIWRPYLKDKLLGNYQTE